MPGGELGSSRMVGSAIGAAVVLLFFFVFSLLIAIILTRLCYFHSKVPEHPTTGN